MTPKFELAAKFLHPMFNRLEVIVLTNKPTNNWMSLEISTSLHYAMPVGNKQCVAW